MTRFLGQRVCLTDRKTEKKQWGIVVKDDPEEPMHVRLDTGPTVAAQLSRFFYSFKVDRG